jgi:hypothetical protein
MIQSRSGTGLALEAFTQLPIVCKFVRQEFQCDKPSEARVSCFVHHAHAARPQLLQDAIVRDGGTDHGNDLETTQQNRTANERISGHLRRTTATALGLAF